MFMNIRNDLSASIVVFLVALPLCLGIALASGAPLLAGLISGIVGGIIVGVVSGSPLGVSGPAAGLVVIVFSAIQTLGSWPAFLTAVMLAGLIQILMGLLKAGLIAYFFPSSVIKGMLSGIGLLIILKQIPHALGYDVNVLGDLAFIEMAGDNTFSSIIMAFNAVSPAATLIALSSLIVMLFWDNIMAKKHRFFQTFSGPLVVVLIGIGFNILLQNHVISLTLSNEHLVNIPPINSLSDLFKQIQHPDFSVISHYHVWKIAIILAVVASLETLLCVEATDKLDPYKRTTETNRELKAQGLGNIICGLIGGLPITQVIIRSSANITFGAKSKLSAILHGVLLLLSVLFISEFLNLIPLSSLAIILILVGYKLAQPHIFRKMLALGDDQFIPFIATILGILFTDLLIGISIGLCVGLFFTLRQSYRNAFYIQDTITSEKDDLTHHIVLAEEVSFFNKASIINLLRSIPEHATVIIDGSKSKSIAHDVIEYIEDYKQQASLKNITFTTIAIEERQHENINARDAAKYRSRNRNSDPA